MIDKKVIDEEKLTDNLTITTSMSYDSKKIFLSVDYMNGKFKIEKFFINNFWGLEEFEHQKNNFITEDKVKKYLDL